MRKMKQLTVAGLILFGSLFLFSAGAFALHPEPVQIPETVDVRHRACQDISRLANKYKVEGLFSKDFEEGKTSCTRMDLATALVLLTEKMAAKVLKEGPAAVDKADLELIATLKDELRAEMILAGTRTFEQRNEELGTRFTALTKNISLSGGLVGVVQGSLGNKPKDYADVVGRGDLVFNFKVGENTIAVIDVEATGGDGIDRKIASFSGLNHVAGSTGDRVRFRQAWVEHSAWNDRLVLTAGKVDLTNYFDANVVANDENSQFLAGGFVNSAVLGAPDIGPGARIQAKLAEPLIFSLGYGSGDADSADSFDHGFGIAQLDYKVKFAELGGTYRVYGSVDGALPVIDPATGEPAGAKIRQKNALGFGLSLDQQLTEKLTVFARYGQRDRDAYTTRRAWSIGGQYTGLLPQRKSDVLGFAYGQIQAAGAIADSQEKLAELYYKVQLTSQIAIAPVVQYLINPAGSSGSDAVTALALRSQISF
jgi:hypothetical protein